MFLKGFNKYTYLSVISLLLAVSCKKSNTTAPASNVDVYIAGGLATTSGSLNVAGYWKNGVFMKLTDSISGFANAITVNGADIYAAGYTFKSTGSYGISNSNADTTTGTYWHNGQATKVGPNTVCTAIFVSGSDIYVAGYTINPAINTHNGYDDTDDYKIGTFWKNGVPTTFGKASTCTAIAVKGNDVYIAGSQNNEAVYWKNGVVNKLTSNTLGSVANAIAFDGNNLYLAGRFNDGTSTVEAVYWRNGTMVQLATANSIANAIAIDNGNIYIAGRLSATAAFWKNGVMTLLPNLTLPQGVASQVSDATGIAVNGGNVYASGAIFTGSNVA